jgi:hypothetical protein
MFGSQIQGPYKYLSLAQEEDYTAFSMLILAPNGLLAINNFFSEVDPKTQPVPDGDESVYVPLMSKADPANDLAVLMFPNADYWENYSWPLQLGSYTVNDTTGSISSTNTWKNMPIPAVTNVSNMSMSPSGKLLALAAYPGLELFHFDEAAPITPFGGVLLPTVNIDQLGWDNNNHLYALSYSAQELYVYTVTPTSISEVSGAPFVVQNPYGIKGMIVVPK